MASGFGNWILGNEKVCVDVLFFALVNNVIAGFGSGCAEKFFEEW